MSRLSEYRDAVFQDPIGDAIKRANERLAGGGTATATGAGVDVRNIGGRYYVVDVNGKAVSRPYNTEGEARDALRYGEYTMATTGMITPPLGAASGQYAYGGGEFFPGDYRDARR